MGKNFVEGQEMVYSIRLGKLFNDKKFLEVFLFLITSTVRWPEVENDIERYRLFFDNSRTAHTQTSSVAPQNPSVS